MKLVHQVDSAPTAPETGIRYGARIKSLTIEGKQVVCNWVIYTRKTRNHKPEVVDKGMVKAKI